MRRTVLTFLLVFLPVLTSCSSSSEADLEFVSTGSFSVGEVRAGSLVTMASITVCVDRDGEASITSLALQGDNPPDVEAFAVKERTRSMAGVTVADEDGRFVGGSTKVSAACAGSGSQPDASVGQVLVISARMASEAVIVRSLEVEYVVDGVSVTRTVPLRRTTFCPRGHILDEPSGTCAPGRGQL